MMKSWDELAKEFMAYTDSETHWHICYDCGVKWPHGQLIKFCLWPNPWFCPDCELQRAGHERD